MEYTQRCIEGRLFGMNDINNWNNVRFMFVIFTDKTGLYSSWPGIGYLVSAIKEEFSDLIIDVRIFDIKDVDVAVKEINNYNEKLIIGLSLYQHNFKPSMNFARAIKEIRDDIFIVAGNVEASAFPKAIMEDYPCIDSIIAGEGEYVLPNLIKCIIKNDYSKCNNIYYRSAGIIKCNCIIQEFVDVNNLHYPDRSFLPTKVNCFDIVGSRGCKMHCTFCSDKCVHGNVQRMRRIEDVCAEVDYLVANYSCKYVLFSDSSFGGEGDDAVHRLRKFKEHLKSREYFVQFYIFLRPDQITELVAVELVELQKYGLETVMIGFESGDQEDLKLYGKNNDLSTNIKAARILEKHGIIDGSAGITLKFGFINFNPYTTMEKLKNNYRFIDSLKINVELTVFMTQLYIYSGSPISRKLYKDGILIADIKKPILNPLCYNFKERKTQEFYSTLAKANLMLRLVQIPYFIQIYNRYTHYFGSNKEAEEIYREYLEYRRSVSKGSKMVYRTLLCMQDDNKYNEQHIEEICRNIQNKINIKANKLICAKNGWKYN